MDLRIPYLRVLLLVVFAISTLPYNDIIGQNDASANAFKLKVLDEYFFDYEIVELEASSYLEQLREANDFVHISLELGKYGSFDLELLDSEILGPNYKLRSASSGTISPDSYSRAFPAKGMIEGDGHSHVRLTFNHHFINGYIKSSKDVLYIEPLSYYTNTQGGNQFIVYNRAAVKPDTDRKCGLVESEEKTKSLKKQKQTQTPQEKAGECFEIELAIASDYLMYLDYNESTQEVEDHNIAVMNDVQGNWDDEFADELIYVIVEQWISDCSTCDPWTSSTNAGTLLSSFRNWAPNGFDEVHDVGQLWTDRDFNGGTVGIAYVSVVCTGLRYHCLQDFTTNSNSLRVLTAHELGHNFSAQHDPTGGFIMSPSVNNSNQWSSASVNSINNHVASRTCLANCPIDEPPTALFESTDPDICAGESIHFTDTSLGSPTTWDWTFDGGTPSSSTDQNPVVVYNTPGTYNVTLFVTNAAGSDDTVAVNHVTVTAQPFAFFTYEHLTDQIVGFNNESGVGNYFWQFGDGQSSTEVNPQHFYSEDGEYTVILTVTNSCGTDTYLTTVTIVTPPTADFSASQIEGCSPLDIFFFDLSSDNTTSWEWSFPGGSPSSSTEQNPVITYSTPGVFDVTLTVSNAAGEDSKTISQYITILEDPTANADYVVDGFTVDFTDLSNAADEYFWDFGDGESSAEANPTHVYEGDGTYTVSLTVINDCGQDTYIFQVEISNLPSAGASSDATEGCLPFVVQFSDESSQNVDSWMWTFEGGNPANSTDQNPSVTYNSQGTFDVQLIVSNETGSDTLELEDYISVGEGPNANFGSSTDELDVNFSNNSANAVSYTWDFGDGNGSNDENPSHSYTEDGVYTVMLIASNNCGNDTMFQVLNIVSMPVAGAGASETEGCTPFIVQFNDQSSDNVDAWLWAFEGGNPASSDQQNPQVSYDQAGTYDVQLIVSNEAGSDTLFFEDYIEVGSLPIPGFSFIKDQLTFDFTNESSNANTYHWAFGDGTESNEINPSHTYSDPGTYTVILTASNSCGDEIYTFEVNASAAPTANFSANAQSGCTPFEVSFMDLSSGEVDSWLWTFEGGSPSSSTDQNPVITYNEPGVYNVSLVVTNETGSDEAIFDDFITVNTTPVAGFDFTVDGNMVNFDNTSSNADSYLWTYGPGATTSAVNPSISFPQDGSYEVVLQASNECGLDEITQTVVITAFPNAGISSSANIGCEPFMVEFFDNSTDNATSWEWEFPGGSPEFSTEQNPIVSYSEPGKYSVSLTATNEVGSNSITLIEYVEVKPQPDADYSFDINDAVVDFTNNSQDYETVKWEFGDGEESDELNPSHTYDASGDYTVLLIAFNECGADTFSQLVSVEIKSPIIIFSQSVNEGCAPLQVQFVDQSDNDPLTWNWSFPGGNPATSNEMNPLVTYTEPGVYDISVELTNEFGIASITVEGAVTVLPSPDAGFDFTADMGEVQFNNTSSFGNSYSWDFGDGASSEEEHPIHTYTESGVYTVQLTVVNDCGTDIITQMVNVTVSSIFDPELFEVFAIYPNPNNGIFTIEVEGNSSESIEIRIIDLLGKLIDQRTEEFNSGKLKLLLSNENLEAGTYLVQLVQEEKSSIGKLIIH